MSEEIKVKEELPPDEVILAYLYSKSFTCPVCQKEFGSCTVRRSKLRQVGIDRDFRTRYKDIDPNLYDVVICSHCGYGALSNYFDRILSKQADWVKEQITPGYKHVEYDLPMKPIDALARYKHAVACAQATKAKASVKSIIFLKMAWVCRSVGDVKNELAMINLSYTNLKEAFTTESFPLGNMDEHTAKYMLAEMARRLGDFDEASRMIGSILVSRTVSSSIKDKAQDMKDLIREKISDQV